MPRSCVEGAVYVRDEVMLCKVKFNFAKKLRERLSPNVLSCGPGYGFVCFGSLSCGCFTFGFPPVGVDVVGVFAS